MIEANPSLIDVIARQKQANSATFAIEHAAIAYAPGLTVDLNVDEEFISATVGGPARSRVISVPSLTLERLLARYDWTGATLLCDIEGVETELVDFEGDVIARRCDTIIMEVHPEFRTPAQCDGLMTKLDTLGFERVASVRKVHAFRHRRALDPATLSTDNS